MLNMPDTAFIHSPIFGDDGSIAFRCSSDTDRWPWLRLDPQHPILVQTINYWASIETAHLRGTIDPDKWSALTETEWSCGLKGAGRPVRGVAELHGDEASPGYGLAFFDADDALVHRMTGTGVVFKTRDFEAWRDKARSKMGVPPAPEDFVFAPAEAIGVVEQGWSFISPLIDEDIPSASGLITKANGFPPIHPYLSGSGDHVNSTHLVEAGRQFASLLSGGKSLRIMGGEMRFTRYVELGYPFHVQLVDRSADEISMMISQAEKPCTAITLRTN